MNTGVHRNNSTERDLLSVEACVTVSTGFYKKITKNVGCISLGSNPKDPRFE